MSKTYKGYELLKAISDGEIKENTRIKVSNNMSELIYDGHTLRWENSLEIAWVDNFTNENITFELIEDEEIDIQELEPIMFNVVELNTNVVRIGNKVNELIEAVKQLDKKMNSIEQK